MIRTLGPGAEKHLRSSSSSESPVRETDASADARGLGGDEKARRRARVSPTEREKTRDASRGVLLKAFVRPIDTPRHGAPLASRIVVSTSPFSRRTKVTRLARSAPAAYAKDAPISTGKSSRASAPPPPPASAAAAAAA